MIKTSDSIKLATDIYRIDDNRVYPVILIRTPYGKDGMKFFAEEFAKYGYNTVIQDVRGKYNSEGHFTAFSNEEKDGEETLNWLTEQEWANQIVLYGSSYLGYCALVLTQYNFPQVKAIFNYSGWIQSDDIMKPGGATHLMLGLPWLIQEDAESQKIKLKVDVEDLFNYLPLKDAGIYAGLKESQWGKPFYMIKDFPYAKNRTPIYHLTGWFDFVAGSTIKEFENFKKGSAIQKLKVGPWFHNQIYSGSKSVGDIDFPLEFDLNNLIELAVDWFDSWTKPSNIVIKDSSTELYLMNSDRWLKFKNFPKKELVTKRMFLDRYGNAGTDINKGLLKTKKPKNSFTDSYIFNPKKPVPTAGGANFFMFPNVTGIFDQSLIEKRNDVLTYSTEVLKEEINIIGESNVILFASSEGKDTDFTAKLVDVFPNGKAMIINEGIIRASYIFKNRKLKKSKVYPFKIKLNPVAYTLKKDHRLRLEISSSNFPKYTRNPNTGDHAMETTELIAVKQTIYHSKKYPSQLRIRILKNK